MLSTELSVVFDFEIEKYKTKNKINRQNIWKLLEIVEFKFIIAFDTKKTAEKQTVFEIIFSFCFDFSDWLCGKKRWKKGFSFGRCLWINWQFQHFSFLFKKIYSKTNSEQKNWHRKIGLYHRSSSRSQITKWPRIRQKKLYPTPRCCPWTSIISCQTFW